jgi:hypothetical protein
MLNVLEKHVSWRARTPHGLPNQVAEYDRMVAEDKAVILRVFAEKDSELAMLRDMAESAISFRESNRADFHVALVHGSDRWFFIASGSKGLDAVQETLTANGGDNSFPTLASAWPFVRAIREKAAALEIPAATAEDGEGE